MVRGKNNGLLGESDKADTLNLLDSTDSDVEWLNLPPIKGKKPKKKKSQKPQRETGISIWGMMKVFLILSLVGAIVLLCIISVWLTSELSELRQRFEQNIRLSRTNEYYIAVQHNLNTSVILNISPEKLQMYRPNKYYIAVFSSRGSGLCSTCTSVFMFLLLVTCVLVCAGLTWMHVEMRKDLEILRLNLQAVEGRSMASTDDSEKLFKQMAVVNKTLEQQTKSLNNVISDISTMNKTVLQLSGRVDKLGEGLKSAPELKQLPEKLQTVSQSVATMGSDIQSLSERVDKMAPFMKTISDEIDSLKKEFENIREKLPTDENAPDRESMKPDEANMIQGYLQTLNSSLSTQMSGVLKSYKQQEERISQLEQTTLTLVKNISSISTEHTSISSEHASLSDDYTSDNFKSSVTDIVNGLLPNASPVPSSSNVVETNITQVLSNVKELEEKYENLLKQPSSVPADSDEVEESEVKYVTMEMFKTLGDGFESQVENLNNSFIKLKADVSTMAQILTSQTNVVANLSHQVEDTKMFLVTLHRKLEQTGEHTPFVSKGPVLKDTTSTLKVTTVKPPEEKMTEGEEDKIITSGTSTSTAGPTKAKKVAINVDWIKTPEELDLNFRRWDRGSTGQVNYNVLNGYLGPQTPKEEDLKPFDEDGNGLYSLQEFAKAFGMTLTTEESATEPAIPPR